MQMAKNSKQGISRARRLLCSRLVAAELLALGSTGVARAAVSPGDLIIADSQNANYHGIILDVNPITGAQHVIASGGFLTQPTGICVDSSGNLIVADFGGSTVDDMGAILRINPNTGAQSVISSGNGLRHPISVTLDPNGFIVANNQGANLSPPAVLRIDPTTGSQTLLSLFAQSDVPWGLTSDGKGNFFQSLYQGFDSGGSRIVAIDGASGAATPVSTGGLLNIGPLGIWQNQNEANSLFVNEAGSASLLLDINTITGAQSVVSRGGNLLRPVAVTQDLAGNTYVTDDGLIDTPRGLVLQITPITGGQTIIASGGSLITPTAIAFYVPEPASLTLVVLIAAPMMLRRRR